MRTNRVVAVTLAAALGTVLAACGSSSSKPSSSLSGASNAAAAPTTAALHGVLKIGVINPASGAQAPGGEAIFDGYQLAVDEANQSGGVLGKEVQLVKADASTPEQGISEVNRLATSESVDVFAGTYISAVAVTASQTALRYGKLYWDTNALASSLTERGLTNFVRSGPSATQFANVSADAVQNLVAPAIGGSLSGLKIYISHEDSVYGSSIAAVQEKALKAAGATVTADVGYKYSDPDLGSVILRGQQTNPDVWLETGYVPDSSLLMRTAKQQNFRPKAIVLVGTGDTSDVLKAVGADQLQGVFVVGYPHTDISPAYGPGADKFLSEFKAKYGAPPVFPQSMAAYTGMQMLLDALKTAKSTDPATVRSAISTINKPLQSFATGFGEKFDSTFQNVNALPTVVQWQSGQTVTVYPKAAAPSGAKVVGLG